MQNHPVGTVGHHFSIKMDGHPEIRNVSMVGCEKLDFVDGVASDRATRHVISYHGVDIQCKTD